LSAALWFTAEPQKVSPLTYDAQNRLQTVTNTNTGDVTTFTYDADGRRVRRHTVADTIAYVGSHYEEQIPQHDLNDDCVVNVVDIMLAASCWGCQCGDDCYESIYDFDGDCEITVADIMLVAVHWRERCTTVKYYACISLQTLAHSSTLKVWARRLGLMPALFRAWTTSLSGRANPAARAL
jgi:YD repeat-containing protein